MMEELDEEADAIRIEVAEKVGWRNVEYSVAGVLVGYPPAKGSFRAVPSFARDIRAAWELIDQVFAVGLRITTTTLTGWGKNRGYAAEILRGRELLAHGEGVSAPLAICRAYLKTPAAEMTTDKIFAKAC